MTCIHWAPPFDFSLEAALLPRDIATQITSDTRPNGRRRELEIKTCDRISKEWEEVIAACLQKDHPLDLSSAGKLLELLGLKKSGATSGTKTFSPGSIGSSGSKNSLQQPHAAVCCRCGSGHPSVVVQRSISKNNSKATSAVEAAQKQ